MVREGRTDLTLVVLAEAAGTSDRMLVYHFESKDALVADLLVRAVERLAAALLTRIQAKPGQKDPGAVVQQLWDALREPETSPYIQLFFEVYGLSFPHPELYKPVVRQVVESWIVLIEGMLVQAGVPARKAARTGTMVVAAIEGLLLAEHALGEDKRITATLRDLKALARSAAE